MAPAIHRILSVDARQEDDGFPASTKTRKKRRALLLTAFLLTTATRKRPRMISPRNADPFAEVDRIVCGASFVSEETAARARALQAAVRTDEPLSLKIATALLRHRRERTALFTGFVVPDAFPCGENDGPLGTVSLARALKRAGFTTTIYVDPQVLDHTTWLAAEIGAGVPVVPIPEDPSAVLATAIDVAIAVEKPGENAEGYLHAWSGQRIEAGSISIDALFARLNDEGKLTVAIGDRGNEIGFGAIYDEVLRLVPETHRCTCGCGGGTAAVTSAKLLYPATVSNWGAYGLCVGLALVTGDRSLLLRPDEEERLLNVAAVRGCPDGSLKTAAFGVDGIGGTTSIHVVNALCEVADTAVDVDRRKKAPVRGSIEGRNEALHE
jgi:hypothetical protein